LGAKTVNCGDRVHFFALCASIIRGIIVDHVRAHTASKRGGGVSALRLTDAAAVLRERGPDLIAIDEALIALAQMDPRLGRVVELRFFAGLTVKETAEAMRISPETVKRDWRVAKLWLIKELGAPGRSGGRQPLSSPR
jgi:RNA polymerase sigma factor (TIGR02999 family)